MAIDPTRFQQLLSEFELEQLFNELGWDHARLAPQVVNTVGDAFTLRAIAQKRSVVVFLCSPNGDGEIPQHRERLKIEKEAAQIALEHLLIFSDQEKSKLTWLWTSRVPGKPMTTRSHTWHRGSSGESLRQKLEAVVWSLEEEEAITLTDVITGLRRAFDKDKVTKRFFDRFRKEREAFAGFIEGFQDRTNIALYASLMLNRLMFVFFIQRKGFLDDNPNYLTDRLVAVRALTGEGHFHSFYREFLLRLFHEGFARPENDRGADFSHLMGRVPYLNGGLFEVHELEDANPDLDIPDEAFENLFAFFDSYDWHLDDRPLAKDNEINPDVLGYIFEKYINQKQMGAYYTKEDITEFISKNTIVPNILERAQESCKVAFEGQHSTWRLLRVNPDRYLYPSMKTGVIDATGEIVPESHLPTHVRQGMLDPTARLYDKRYNLGQADFYTATGERGGLPNETWREYVERRNRCLKLRAHLAAGEVSSTEDLITHNLNVRQLLQDIIDTTADPDLLRAIWETIVGRVPQGSGSSFRRGITILDPTCGSGAFLFAALNVLEPLYEGCLDRMEGFLEDAANSGQVAEADFAETLSIVSQHSSRSYFVYKSIILNNLYGVDIMSEAVEICKLRLFLKLVSQVNHHRELEPLPDMDFNIRTGNTLVGFASLEHVKRSLRSNLINALALPQIEERADAADRAYQAFQEIQTRKEMNTREFANAKLELRGRLDDLRNELDRYLIHEFAIDAEDHSTFSAWRVSHQPFHWIVEFYGIMSFGGFDVVIGNPPYVEINKLNQYRVIGYDTKSAGNLYALVMERCFGIAHQLSHSGFIVPVSSVSADRYAPLRQLTTSKNDHFSSFNDRPSRLFDGLEHCRLTIHIMSPSSERPRLFSTNYQKWTAVERLHLFQTIHYTAVKKEIGIASMPKMTCEAESSILAKLLKQGTRLSQYTSRGGGATVYYTRKIGSFVQILDFIPQIEDARGERRPPTELKLINFDNVQMATSALCCLNSSLFYWFLTVFSDCRNLNRREIDHFPVDLNALSKGIVGEKLSKLAASLMKSMSSNSEIRKFRSRNETLAIQCTFPRFSKHIIDEIDAILGEFLGLTGEELDFITNYEIKYRLGLESSSSDVAEV